MIKRHPQGYVAPEAQGGVLAPGTFVKENDILLQMTMFHCSLSNGIELL
jgi:hypothetical protein